jgi:hypothetical protein
MRPRRLLDEHPAETAAGGLATVIGAVFVILGGYGVRVPAEVPGAVIVLVGYVAAAVTRYRKRRRTRADR